MIWGERGERRGEEARQNKNLIINKNFKTFFFFPFFLLFPVVFLVLAAAGGTLAFAISAASNSCFSFLWARNVAPPFKP